MSENNPSDARWEVGLDEAGKGDYFGPLVVAAVAGRPSALVELGVADSKRVADAKCARLARAIREAFPVETVVISPEKYNELYGRIKNLNKLLAWAHARALENMLKHVTPTVVIVDQFAHARVLEAALLDRGGNVRLQQVTGAEAHAVVAAASIVARAEFVARLERLEERMNVRLPKGAGAPVDSAGREIVQSGGTALLEKVAKLHFKTTQKIGAFNSSAR